MGTDPTEPTPPDALAAPVVEIGARLDGYVIQARLGAGGMGTVFRARDTVLGRAAAIKILHPRLLGRGADELVREAQSMARLSHANVVPIYAVGTIDGAAYLAMELIDGQTLRAWLAERPRPRAEILAAFTAAGRGVAAAHAAGLVHRDFKPDNVLVGRDGQVRVCDFGLARGPGEPGAPPSPALGAAGTPAYMAPEQHEGGEVDGRADQFAFAVALHEALLGVRPFAGDSAEVVRRNVLAGARATAPARGVPGWLRAVLDRGLARDPARRFPDMDALLAELGRDRRRPLRLALVAGGLALAAGLGVLGVRRLTAPAASPCAGGPARLAAVWNDGARAAVQAAFVASKRPDAAALFTRTAAQLDRYGAAWVAMYQQTCAATAVDHTQPEPILDLRMDCLDRRLGQVASFVTLLRGGDAKVVTRAPGAARQLDDLAACADEEALGGVQPLPANPQVRRKIADVRLRLDRARLQLRGGGFKDALASATPLADEARALAYDPLVAETLMFTGQVTRYTGDSPGAEKLLREAALAAERAHDDRLGTAVWTFLIYSIGSQPGRFEEAMALLPAAEAAVVRRGDHPKRRVQILEAVSAIQGIAGLHVESLATLRKAVALLEAQLGPKDPYLSATVFNIALTLGRLGRLDDAVDAFKRTVALEQNRTAGEDLSTYRSKAAMCVVLVAARRLAEARSVCAETLVMTVNAHGPDDPILAPVYLALGEVAYLDGRGEDAIALGKRAATLNSRSFIDGGEGDSSDLIIAAGELLLGRADTAVAGIERVLPKLEGADSPRTLPRARFLLAQALWAAGKDRPRARALAEQARAALAALDAQSHAQREEVEAWLASH